MSWKKRKASLFNSFSVKVKVLRVESEGGRLCGRAYSN